MAIQLAHYRDDQVMAGALGGWEAGAKAGGQATAGTGAEGAP